MLPNGDSSSRLSCDVLSNSEILRQQGGFGLNSAAQVSKRIAVMKEKTLNCHFIGCRWFHCSQRLGSSLDHRSSKSRSCKKKKSRAQFDCHRNEVN